MPRAVQQQKLGPFRENLKMIEIPPMEPLKGQAVVNVLSSGICFGEIIGMEGNHAIKPSKIPFTVGGEICGRVTKVGEGCDLKVGSLVFGMCESGGLAEEARVAPNMVYVAPEGLDPHMLAGFVDNYSCSYHALKDIGKLQPGERLCVLGAAGGVGLAAVEIGKAMGANVVACASSADKLQACKESGADVLIDYSLPGFKDRIRKEAGGPLDLVYDPVGGEFSEPALRALGFGGRHLVVGFATGGTTPANAPDGAGIPKIPLNLALLNERQILGCFNVVPKTRMKNVGELLELLVSGKLKPRPPTVLPLEKFVEGYEMIVERKVIGKICISTNPPTTAARL